MFGSFVLIVLGLSFSAVVVAAAITAVIALFGLVREIR
jgi:hypothetical protein